MFAEGALAPRNGYIDAKPQIDYLNEYCERLGVRSIVYEPEYIDRHFSEDFGGYYVRCFGAYRKKCSRVHFFGTKVTPEQISKLLIDQKSPDDVARKLKYHGFAVIKPLPETVIGRTCLTPQPPAAAFPTLRSQRANLFGMDFALESLPFQEQDNEVAACATSALWSVLHGTARLFDHPILSPLEITRAAQAQFPLFGRALPNDGLDMYQMAGVVQELGLEAEIIDVGIKFILQSYAYAYLRGGVPILFGIDFNMVPGNAAELHAIALTGYQMTKKKPQPAAKAKFNSVASRIERFYAHDDGVGPFAPIDLVPSQDLVLTSWKDARGRRIKARPDQVLVPLYSQIRTPYVESCRA
jgi:hypothetical protein